MFIFLPWSNKEAGGLYAELSCMWWGLRMLYLFINTVYYATRIVLNMDTYREHSYLYPKACGVDEYNDVHHLSVLWKLLCLFLFHLCQYPTHLNTLDVTSLYFLYYTSQGYMCNSVELCHGPIILFCSGWGRIPQKIDTEVSEIKISLYNQIRQLIIITRYPIKHYKPSLITCQYH